MIDENGKLVMINAVARSLLGFNDTETVTTESIGQLESDKNISSLLQNAFDKAERLEEEVVLGKKGGKRIKIEITPVIDPNGMKIGSVAILCEA